MGWPDSPYLWRENAKPAQEQYAAVAKAISQFEPLTMLANPEVRSWCSSISCFFFLIVWRLLCFANVMWLLWLCGFRGWLCKRGWVFSCAMGSVSCRVYLLTCLHVYLA